MNQFRKILVPTDFSAESMAALNYAGLFATTFKAEIILLHVLETYEYNAVLDNLGVKYEDVVKQGVEEKLKGIISGNKVLAKATIRTLLLSGKVHRVIHQVAREEGADLIVMGTHGASGVGDLEKFMLGSNAYRTVNGSQIPVLTVRHPDKAKKIERIILPLDITKQTTQKVDFAIEIAKRFKARIYVVSVTEFLDDFNPQINKIPLELEQVEAKLNEAGVENVIGEMRYRDVAKGILEFAAETQGDLILIMTRQETLFGELIVGSHARKIINQSELPVLSIQPRKKN